MSRTGIKSNKHMAMAMDFSMHNGNVGFTDIDLVFEKDGRVFIFGEGKKAGAWMNTGQRKLYSSLVSTLRTADGVKALAFKYEWSAKDLDSNGNIYVPDCKVTMIWSTKNQWKSIKNYTVYTLLLELGTHYDCETLKNLTKTPKL